MKLPGKFSWACVALLLTLATFQQAIVVPGESSPALTAYELA